MVRPSLALLLAPFAGLRRHTWPRKSSKYTISLTAISGSVQHGAEVTLIVPAASVKNDRPVVYLVWDRYVFARLHPEAQLLADAEGREDPVQDVVCCCLTGEAI